MTHFSVVQIDMHTAPYVAATGSARSAQILARLVAERCPDNVFGICDSADFIGPKSNGFILDCPRPRPSVPPLPGSEPRRSERNRG